MSELEKLRALLDVTPTNPRPLAKAAPPERRALRPGPPSRRRWLIILFVILALDAIYLLARALMG